MLRVTVRYAERLLSDKVSGPAGGIAGSLVEEFPTHGYVISYDEAKGLHLPVRPIAEYDLLGTVRPVHRAVEDGNPLVRFSSMDSFLGLENTSDDSSTDQEIEDEENENVDEGTQAGPHAGVGSNGGEASGALPGS